ncbi:HDOD domain-containing protein [Bordetella sp. FB-8]|uniref:HDOD domain-containing protein n=1 Tax=Bordetella sp. FB-8 TaxID=1159870 RepID=UPI00036676C1|nr:HDOD domain-containing protein [Bordetella sp. FB-8]
MDLKTLIDQPGKLPTIPKIVQKLIASFNSEDISSSEIAHQIESDPALSAKLLRLANSAYFHVSRTVGTVDEALRMLGFVMVRNLVISSGMVAAFRNTPGINLPRFWRYTLYTACSARWLATRAEANGDLVFTLSMMHGIGQLQMHLCMAPDLLAPIEAQAGVLDPRRAEVESAQLGFHYGQVSSELARLWNFPDALIAALAHVPDPLAAAEFSAPTGLVHLGCWRARAAVLDWSADQARAAYPGAVAERLALAPDWTDLLAPDGDPAYWMPPFETLTQGLDRLFD